MTTAFEHCTRLVREGDKDRFLAALFASPERRPLLYALYAFDLEIAAIPSRVSQPLAGEMRIQWWREVVEGLRGDEAAASPVAVALRASIDASGLDRGLLLAALDAASHDLASEGVATLDALAQHSVAAAGSIMRAGAFLLSGDGGNRLDEVVRDAAVATTAVAVLRAFALQSSRGRSELPTDLLRRHGVTEGDLTSGRCSPGLVAALSEFRAAARESARRAMAALPRDVPAAAWPAFIHVGLAPLYLERMERPSYDPFTTLVDVHQWRRQWRLWRLARSPAAFY